ncbi:MAG: hypothetical protein R2911_43995 [Caldilineaceae bacterium]
MSKLIAKRGIATKPTKVGHNIHKRIRRKFVEKDAVMVPHLAKTNAE